VSFTRFGQQNPGATTVLYAELLMASSRTPRTHDAAHGISSNILRSQHSPSLGPNFGQDIPVTVRDAGGFSALQPATEC
jgi:hypothetical protein